MKYAPTLQRAIDIFYTPGTKRVAVTIDLPKFAGKARAELRALLGVVKAAGRLDHEAGGEPTCFICRALTRLEKVSRS